MFEYSMTIWGDSGGFNQGVAVVHVIRLCSCSLSPHFINTAHKLALMHLALCLCVWLYAGMLSFINTASQRSIVSPWLGLDRLPQRVGKLPVRNTPKSALHYINTRLHKTLGHFKTSTKQNARIYTILEELRGAVSGWFQLGFSFFMAS